MLGNPGNRRVQSFLRAVEELGEPAPACLSYAEVLRDPERLRGLRVDLLRLDSPGEDALVAAGLIALGGGPRGAVLEHGEIAFLREYHQGFLRLLSWVPGRCVNGPADIGVMFDKWECHERFLARGVARPHAERAPVEARALLGAAPSGRVFLKPLHGSSASGVCALRWTRDRVQLTAPLEVADGKLWNSLRVRTWTDRAAVEGILDRLLPQGMIAERWIPKLTLADGAVDLRVLVVAGQARHRVLRQSRHPMTNLHLGNRRGDLGELEPRVVAGACRLAEEAAACFPDSLYAGVDVLLDSRGRPFVGEINAFGDLLPGLLDRGESAPTAIARAMYAARCPV